MTEAVRPSGRAKIRKLATFVEETVSEMGRKVDPPTRRAAAVAVIENPYAGRYVDDLSELIDDWRRTWGVADPASRGRIGNCGTLRQKVMARRRLSAKTENWSMRRPSYIRRLGTPVRRVLGKGAALIPSSKKRGGLGVMLDIPLGHKDAAFVRSHFDGMEVRISDAPRANEIIVAIAVTDSGRPLPRVGGLTKDQIKGEDGLR